MTTENQPTTTSPDPGILGLDNVRLDLPLAGLGSRVLAMSVDMILSWLLVLLVAIAISVVAATVGSFGGWLIAILSLAVFLVQVGYFSFFEIALNGQTPGKMLIGLRTVSHLGGRPSIGALVARNFVRTIDLIFGLPLMVLDPRSRRLGDMVAATLVVHDRPSSGLQLTAIPPSWTGREIAVAESFFRRVEAMEPAVALELSTRILEWLRRTDPSFLSEPDEGTPLEQLRGALQPQPL